LGRDLRRTPAASGLPPPGCKGRLYKQSQFRPWRPSGAPFFQYSIIPAFQFPARREGRGNSQGVAGDGVFARKIQNPLSACMWKLDSGFWAGAPENAVLGAGCVYVARGTWLSGPALLKTRSLPCASLPLGGLNRRRQKRGWGVGRTRCGGLWGSSGFRLPGAADRAIISPTHVYHRGRV
jgi:hypothetical protein